MYFSVGILYSAHDFLGFLKSNPKLVSNHAELFNSLDNVASPAAVFEVCQKCEWLRLDLDGYLEITDRGDAILADQPIEHTLRVQIQHLIEAYKPPWLPLFTKGRMEAIKYLPEDVVQCLRDADLITPYSDDVVLWWDKVGKVSRRIGKDEKLDVGRRGEKMSLDHERRRTNNEPKWSGFDSNFLGYDVLSVVDSDNSEPLRIEVKTSNSIWEVATFHLSRNEWEVAKASTHYLFHLWALVPKSTLYVVSPSVVEDHVPTDKGSGSWESVEISFSAVCQRSISGISSGATVTQANNA